MTRKIYLSILALLLATFSLSAQNPQVRIGNVTSGPGEILVPFEMLNFTQPVNSFTFKITANSSLLQFVEVVNRVGFTGPNFQAFQNGNTLSIIYFDIGAGYAPNGKIFDLKFNYTGAANTTLAFIANQQEVTSGINPIANIDYINGIITTTLPIPDPVVDIADVTVAPGAVNVSVEMLNFTNNVNSFTFNLNLPGALLQYVDLQNINPALGAGTLQANQTGNTLQIQWFTNGTGFVPSGTVFQMRFNYVGGFNTDILWLPGSEVTYGPNPVSPISFIKGSVTQVPAVGTVSVGSASVPTGASVSLPVQFNGTGLNNVAAFTLFLQFDQSSLVFAGFSNPIAPELVVNHNNGLISMAWNGAATNFNSASIVNLNFVYTGVVPANLQFLPGCEVNNALATPLPVVYQNGTVSPVASTSIMKIADVTGFAGQTISVPVNATDIGTVGALDLIINWNPQQATLASYNANQLTNWVVNQGAGNIYFQWQDIAGATVNNGAVVTLNFVYHGGGTMPVTFANGSEVTGTNGLPKVVSFQHGSVAQNFSNSQAVIGTVNSCSGNTAIVPVNLVDVGIVSSFSFSIGYTGSVLTYVELVNVNPALTGLQVNQLANTLNVQWQNVNPVNLNGKLFDIVFSYAGAANSPVVFNAGSEITGVGATVLPVTFVNGAVNCNIETRVLTVNTTGNGSVVVMDGLVVLLPDANTTNQYTVEYGKVLTLEATGDLGWQFANWTGPVNSLTTASTTINMINNAFVTANFTMIDYTLTLVANPVAGGVVTGAGIYNFGQQVAVDAVPNTGYAFVNWTDGNGNVVSTQTANTISMPASDLTLTANFALIDYTLTLVANPVAGGTVTGGGVYNYNQQVSVDAIPNTGYEFVNWTDGNGNVVSTQAANVISMPASDLTLTANFALINYTLTLNVNPAAGGTVTGAGTYTFGQQVSVDATANEGYSFVNWTDANGNVVSTQPANVITMPASDLTLTANFALNNYTLTLVANPTAGGTVTGGGSYPFGSQVNVNAVPNSGWNFVNWTDAGGNVVSTQPANVISIPASNLTLTANFVLAYVAPFPFSENFDGTAFPPQYWNRYRQGTGATVREWVRSTAQNHTTGGTASAFHNYGPASQTEDGWLVTPKIQLPAAGSQAIQLRFWSYNSFPTYYGKNSVLISTTDGTPGAAFTEVWTVATVAQPWTETVVDLNAYAGQQIYVAFRYEGSDAHGWYLDDVSVDYEPAQFPVITVNPASLSKEVEQGLTASQTLTVGNTGNVALDYTVAIEYVTSKTSSVVTTKPNISEGPIEGEIETAQGNAIVVPQGSKDFITRDVLYNNGPFINSPGTGPGGTDESVLQNTTLGMNTLGAGIQFASGNRMADDVVVAETWNVESITVFAYQTGSTTTSTMTAGYIQIWDGDPTQGGQVIWGDLTTNRMASTGFTNTYRVSQTTINTQRPIMYLVLQTPGLVLQPGTYWIDYTLAGSLASGPWAPPITINGQAVTGNAKQFLGSSSSWTEFLDSGTGTPAQGLPFIVSGTTGGGGPVEWLSVSPLGGTVNAGATADLAVSYNAAGLEVGTYNANIKITSNDPATPLKVVPVTMTVTPSTICYPEPRNLTSSVTGQNVTLNWQAPDLGGGGGGGTVKINEGFEGDFPPTGWVKLNPDGGTGWTALNSGTTPIPGWQGGTATPAPEGGSKMAFATWNTGGATANDQWIVTPQITVENGDQLKFYMRYAFNSYIDNLDVRISTQSQNNPAHFSTVVAQFNFTTTTTTEWQLMTYNLTDFVPAGSQIYIGFREHVLDNFNDGSAVMLDNVYVGPATRSLAPIAYGLPSNIERGNAQSGNTVINNGSLGVSEFDNSGLRGTMPEGVKYMGASSGRAILFDNGPFVNNPGAGPGGSDLSQLHSGMTTFGPSINHGGTISVADDFIVTENPWNIESITFYAYQTSATHPTPPVSTITSGRLRIWNGSPANASSQVVWGDMNTDLMTSTSWTNAYRVSETTVNNQRPIMAVVCSTPGLTLQPGHYWVEWAATGSIASGPWGVPVTINGQTTTGDALQQTTTSGGFVPLVMGGTNTPYGLSFLVEGTVGGGGGGGCNHGELLGYKVYRNNQLIGQTTASVRTYTDNNVPAGNYTYGVTAVYGQPYPGESQPITTQVTVTPPASFPFEETWASGNFTQNSWTFQPSQGNWRIATAGGNPAPSAEFYWSPTATTYSQSLISRDIDATAAVGNVTLEFDIFLDDYANNGNEQMKVYIWNGTTWVLLDTFANTADIPWTTKTYDVSAHALGKVTKVRFEATGATTFDIDWWRIDNIKVFQGQPAPVITVNPASMYHYFFTPGGTTTKTLNIGNTGASPLNWSATIQYTRESAPDPVIVPGGDKDIPTILDIAQGPESNGGEPELVEPSRNPVVLNYDGENATGIGLTNGGTFHVAARFPSSMVSPYVGHNLTSVQVYVRDLPTNTVLMIWGAGTGTAPGPVLRQQNFTPQANAWNTVTLSTPLPIDGTDIWVGYTITHAASAFPAGMDNGPANPNGEWISTDGTSWSRLSTLVSTINRNWNIRATLIPGVTYNWLQMGPPTSGIINPGASVNRTMVFNSTGLTAGRYTANIRIASNDPVTPVKIVPVIMDITVGVDEQQMSDIRVYPVPTSGMLNLKLVDGIELVRVVNTMGQVVMERSLSGKLTDVLNLQGLNAGAYTLQFVNNNGRTFNRTIVVTK